MTEIATYIEKSNSSLRGTKQSQKLVPELRFKEFDGEWEIKKMSDLQIEDYDITYGVLKPEEYIKDGIPMLQIKDVINNEINSRDLHRISSELHNQYKRTVVEVDNIVLSVVGSIGRVAKIPNQLKGCNIHRNLALVKPNEKVSNEFIFQFLLSDRCQQAILKNVIGSTQGLYNLKDLRNLPICLSALPEQQKIASFLSAVDEKIQQLTKKKALLEQYKKGAMQQLFSSQLRFKDKNGKDYPEWDWVGGNELFDNISDKKHNSDLPILAITQDQGAIPRDMIDYKMTVTEKSVAGYKVVQVGDFVISLRTFQGGIEFSDYHGICSPAYIILRPSSDDVDRAFYKFYLKTSFYIKQLQKNLEGIRDGKMISYKYFSEIKLPFPSRPEQQKIANYLSAIDSKIESVGNQISQTQSFKKGLLQQMFV